MTNVTHHTTLGAVLTVITGTMVAPLDEWYALQDFLAGRSLMTHERTVAFDRQAGALTQQFPRLAEVVAPEGMRTEAACLAWVAEVAAHVGWTEADVHAVEGCEVDAGEAFDLVLDGLTRR